MKLFALIVTTAFTSLWAKPELKSVLIQGNEAYELRIVGNNFPEFKSLSLIFNYNPALVDPNQVTVSSPLAKSAFSALLDSTHRKLFLNIIATSTISMNNGENVSIIKGQGNKGNQAFLLSDALYVDKSGARLKPEIVTSSVAPIHFATTFSLVNMTHGRAVFGINGARRNTAKPLSAGVWLSAHNRRFVPIITLRNISRRKH